MDKSKLVNKWSSEILDHGFTALPNLLIENIDNLNLMPSHVLVLLCIEKHRWRNDRPWPSIETLASLSGLSRRRVSEIVSELEDDFGLIKRIRRDGKTSLYDLDPLVETLNLLASPENIPVNVLRTKAEHNRAVKI